MSRFKILAFCVAALSVLSLAILPPFSLPGNPDDKILHIGAFFALALLASALFPRAHGVLIWLNLSVFAAIIELVQFIMRQGREADWYDFLAGVTAAAAALTCDFVIRRLVIAAKN